MSDSAVVSAVTGPGGIAPRPKERRTGDWAKAFAPRNLADTILAGYLPILLALLIIVLPLAWMVLSSFKPPSEILTLNPTLLPQEPTLDNYAAVAERVPLLTVLRNSVIVTAVGASIKVLLAVTTAYALVFIRVRGANLIFLGILVALMVPPEVSMLPNYLTISSLGGRNTLWGIILPGLGTAFGTFLLRQAFLSLPHEVLDAAKVDGCGHLRLLWDVVLPMARPVLVTFGLISLVAKWNDYLWPLVVTNQDRMRTLAVGISYLYNPETITRWGPVMAATFFVIAPLIAIYIWAQRHIIEGITAGATKG